jgi:lysozyme family protein
MPLKVGEVVGNIAVNAGPGRASKWLQTALGVVADGQIGPKTLAALKGQDPAHLANALLERTEQHYRSIANGRLAKFLRGWLNRNRDMKRYIDRL